SLPDPPPTSRLRTSGAWPPRQASRGPGPRHSSGPGRERSTPAPPRSRRTSSRSASSGCRKRPGPIASDPERAAVDFAFSPDQELLRGAARAFLDERVSSAVVRALWADPRGSSDASWKEMARLGWLGLGLPEAFGGSGLGMVETAILLEELGRVAWPGPFLETALAARALVLAGSDAQRRRWLTAVATGDARGTVAFLDRDLD